MITVNGLAFCYQGKGSPALNHVDLQVGSGSLFGLLGPNGAGKSTLLSILSGLLPCPSNSVFIDGRDISCLNVSTVGLSLVPQEYAFYDGLTVAENLSFFAGIQGLRGAELKSRVNDVAQITGVEERLQSNTSALSGGLKRRLNLAIGLLNRPNLLLLDEPTVGIDPHSRHFILETIRHLNQQGTTIVYTSHYMEEVEALCDQIAIIDNGRVLKQGRLCDLLQTQVGSRQLTVDVMDEPSQRQASALIDLFAATVSGKRLTFDVSADMEIRGVLDVIGHHNLEIRGVHLGARNLEEAFLDMTQRSLRD